MKKLGVQEAGGFFVYQQRMENSFTGVGSLCREFTFVVRDDELTIYNGGYEQIYRSAPLPLHVQGITTCEGDEDDEDGPISILLIGYEGQIAKYLYYPSKNVLDSDWCIELYQSVCDFIILNGRVVVLSNSRVVILQLSNGSLFREMPFEGVGINLFSAGGNVIVETNRKTYNLKLSQKAASLVEI